LIGVRCVHVCEGFMGMGMTTEVKEVAKRPRRQEGHCVHCWGKIAHQLGQQQCPHCGRETVSVQPNRNHFDQLSSVLGLPLLVKKARR